MATNPRIAVFYSPGHNFAAALRRVKEAWPDATLIAWVPPSYEVPQDCAASEVRRTAREHYGLRDLSGLASLVSAIRAERCDRFIVLFDSGRLRMLAALSGARECYHCPPRGRLVALSNSMVRTALCEAGLLVSGRATNLWVQLAVRFLKVR